MQTRVPIVSSAFERDLTGQKVHRMVRVMRAVMTGASELLGRHVEDLHPSGDNTYYAMPKRERRERRAGMQVEVEKITKRFVYLKGLE